MIYNMKHGTFVPKYEGAVFFYLDHFPTASS